MQDSDEAFLARAYATGFEASIYKPTIIERTDGTGDLLVTVAFRVRGDSCPEELIAARAGAIFMMVGVQLDGVGGPKAPAEDWGLKAIKLSHAICRNTEFLIWTCDQAGHDPAMLDIPQMRNVARGVIHSAIEAACGSRSRANLRHNASARVALYDLVNRFHQSQRKTGWLGIERERES